MAVARRPSHAAAYIKSTAAIRDLLALMGAHDAVLAFEEAQIIAGRKSGPTGRPTRPREPRPAEGAARARRDAIAALDLSNLDISLGRSPSSAPAPASSLAELAAGPARRSRNRRSQAECSPSRP